MAFNLWLQYPELAKDIEKVKHNLQDKISVDYPDLQAALSKMASNGGKFLRPAFFLLFTKLTADSQNRVDDKKLIDIATSLEVLHMSTLIHDSPKRRGEVSVQSQFGKDIAVYAGDYLFTVFFDLITDNVLDTPFFKINSRTMKKILLGELNQMKHRYNTQQTFLNYLRNVNGKTAYLFRLASAEGAYFGGASSQTVSLATRIGQNIGISFQILDDILDYSDASRLNKPTLEDLATGVYSLPLLLVLNEDSDELHTLLAKKQDLTLPEIQRIQALVVELGGVEKAKDLAAKFTNKALIDIDKLPDSTAKKKLAKLTKVLLKRTN